ncbi:hypothetical protein ACEWY4_005309 [Coilia grayii]|uniref:S100P-binding protein n=1 Tax=Coilia grayii TaxID=363190 RepID=A0ABD1KI65_9TELE
MCQFNMSRQGSPTAKSEELQSPKGERHLCPVLGSAEIARLSPIRSSKEPLLLESCEDEGYITRSFIQDLPFTPVISTPLRGPRSAATLPVSEFSLDDTDYSWESTLLQVQVKSKVVLPKSRDASESSTPPDSSPAVSTFKAGRRVTPPSHKRPRVFNRPNEWQKEKDKYVQAVTQHMREKPKGGVMNELLDLMNTVASEQHPWQHPSDLTTRNYKPANHGGSLYSLEEWKESNGGDYRRFSRY